MVITFDPGATTGWASSGGGYGEISGRLDIWAFLDTMHPDRIVAERFVGGKNSDPSACHIIGILLLYGDINGIPVELKSPPPHSMRPTGYRRHEAVALALLALYG